MTINDKLQELRENLDSLGEYFGSDRRTHFEPERKKIEELVEDMLEDAKDIGYEMGRFEDS